MKSNQFAKTLIFLCLVVLTGCGTQALPTPIPSPTIEEVSVVSETDESVVTETPTAKPTFTPSPSPSPEPTATNTLVPTVTTAPTPSPAPEPMAKIDETITGLINVRAGPGTDYPTIAQLEATGQELPVTGRNEDSSWWQISLTDTKSSNSVGWIFGNLVFLSGNDKSIPIAEIPPLPTAIPEPVAVTETETETESETESSNSESEPPTAEQLADELRCGKDFCVTYQEMVPIWENGGCVGNHSIYITVLKGLPPGEPMDGVVIGDTYNNVEVASGSHGPGRTEITLWSNSMTLIAKRNIDDTPYTSEESFNFTALDELIPAEVLAASGYCESNVENCRQKQQVNQICRGHYSWRVTFHKFD